MSIDICTKCGKPVDTDIDLDSYDTNVCICERCREIAEDEEEPKGYFKRVDVDDYKWIPYDTRY